jgi:Mrp family chromosome partitioning ATPase
VESDLMEGYRRLRTVVLLAKAERSNGDGRRAEVILVTSPSPREGKTTTVAHLAAVLAENNQRVLAISADLRKPRLHRLLSSKSRTLDDDPQDDQPWTIVHSDVDGVDVLIPLHPKTQRPKLLRDVGRILERARDHYDVIVIDTPPVLVANDALELVPVAHHVVFTARFRTTRDGAAERAADHVHQVGGDVLGVVLTNVSGAGGYAYYYGHKYGYGSYGDDAKPSSTALKATSKR